MSFTGKAAFAAALLLPLAAPLAADRGTADEAMALINKATAHFQAVGKDKALDDFTNDKADYTDRDLYIACLDQNGIWTAHGMNKALIGRDMTKVMDADGRPIGVMVLEQVKKDGQGWLDYRWPNPVTKKVEAKSTFSRMIGDQVCGVGIYK